MSNPVNEDDRANDLAPEARGMEAALSRLRPSAGAGAYEAAAPDDAALAFRDRVMFRAGQAAGEQNERSAARRQVWAWRGTAAALAVTSIAVSARAVMPPHHAVEVVYIHDVSPRTQAGIAKPASREWTNVSTERQNGQADQVANGAIAVAPASGWIGLRGDYLGARAAVLRWGVAALPRVEGSAGEGPTPTPLDEVKKLFWHKSDGGRL